MRRTQRTNDLPPSSQPNGTSHILLNDELAKVPPVLFTPLPIDLRVAGRLLHISHRSQLLSPPPPPCPPSHRGVEI